MYTKIKTKDGEQMEVVTQQYEIGTYVIINGNPANQFGVSEKEDLFHAKLRKKAIKNGDSLLSGSVIALKGKSKFDINKFEQP